jgi:hypothetical protein
MPRGVGQLSYQGHGRRGVEDVEQLVLRSVRGFRQEIEIKVSTDHRRHRQRTLGVFPESHYPATDDLTYAVGQGHLIQGYVHGPAAVGVLIDGSDLRQMAKNLAHEERVAVGFAIHGMGEADPCVLEGLTGSRLKERHHPTVIQPCQFDAGDRALSS